MLKNSGIHVTALPFLRFTAGSVTVLLTICPWKSPSEEVTVMWSEEMGLPFSCHMTETGGLLVRDMHHNVTWPPATTGGLLLNSVYSD